MAIDSANKRLSLINTHMAVLPPFSLGSIDLGSRLIFLFLYAFDVLGEVPVPFVGKARFKITPDNKYNAKIVPDNKYTAKITADDEYRVKIT